MSTSFSDAHLSDWAARIARVEPPPVVSSDARRPVHVVYGGAHLFSRDVVAKMGKLAVAAFDEYAATPADMADAMGMPLASAELVHARVRDKLVREPIEDLRIDFEDGYGPRPDAEEDGHATRAAAELAAARASGALPANIGIRPKALTSALAPRALRTLDLFFTALGSVPDGIIVTLPKVVHPAVVDVAADALDVLEAKMHAKRGAARLELMIETPESLIDADGRVALAALVRAGRGRVSGVHLGAYDLTASAGVAASAQRLGHPLCTAARALMLLSLSGSPVAIADGATTVMPIGPHKGTALSAEQRAENRAVVTRAWRLAYANVRRALDDGIYQGWDLHPAQLPARYAATYAFFREGLADATARLRAFRERAAQATRVGAQFDDAATGRGLVAFFERARATGALSDDEMAVALLRTRRAPSARTAAGRPRAPRETSLRHGRTPCSARRTPAAAIPRPSPDPRTSTCSRRARPRSRSRTIGSTPEGEDRRPGPPATLRGCC